MYLVPRGVIDKYVNTIRIFQSQRISTEICKQTVYYTHSEHIEKFADTIQVFCSLGTATLYREICKYESSTLLED